MAIAYRTDIGALRSPRETSNGTVLADAWASRIGIQVYQRSDGSLIRELRPAAEVFAADSLQAFEGLILTDDHPDVAVTSENARGLAVGTVLSGGREDSGHVAVQTAWHDGSTIRKMRRGKRQLSVGYAVDLDETPGTDPEFGEYDAIQRNIRPNHLALVDRGRAGSAEVKMDSAAWDALGARFGLATDVRCDVAIAVQRDDAAATVEWSSYSGARVCVSTRALSIRDLVAQVGAALAGVEGLTVSEARRADDDVPPPAPVSIEAPRPEVCVWSSDVNVYVTSEDLSPDALHAKVREALASSPDLHVRDTAVCSDRATALDNASAVPDTHGMTLEQAQAALAAANEKAGAAKRDADQAVAERDAAKAEAEQARKDAEASKIDADNARKFTEQAEKHAAQAKADAEAEIAAARKDAADAMAGAVAKRVALLTTANAVLGATDKDGKALDRGAMSDREIKAAVIKHVDGDDVAADASETYVDGMFDGACRRHDKGRTSLAGARAAINDARQNPGAVVPQPTASLEAQAKAKLHNDNQNRWRQQETN